MNVYKQLPQINKRIYLTLRTDIELLIAATEGDGSKLCSCRPTR